MRFEQHCARCKELLGEEFPQVHRWLDELAWKRDHSRGAWALDEASHSGPTNPYHRKHRHNCVGIEHVFKTWGPEAAEAAKLHILDDLFGPCPHTQAQIDQIPIDERDYVKKGWV